jgi:hypothetical protein
MKCCGIPTVTALTFRGCRCSGNCARKATAWFTRQRKQEVDDLAATLTRIASLDFAPFFTMKNGEGTVAEEITRLFRRAAPDVYGYYYFSGLLRAGEKEPIHPSIASLRAAIG